jgi:hypothetical protein
MRNGKQMVNKLTSPEKWCKTTKWMRIFHGLCLPFSIFEPREPGTMSINVNSFNPSNAILDFGQCRLLNLVTYFGTNLKKHCSAC